MATATGKISLEIVTPTGLAVKEEVDYVAAPSSGGEFGVLPRHIPFLTTLRPGPVNIALPEGKLSFNVGVGFAEAGPDRVTILTESCEPA